MKNFVIQFQDSFRVSFKESYFVQSRFLMQLLTNFLVDIVVFILEFTYFLFIKCFKKIYAFEAKFGYRLTEFFRILLI